MPVGLRLPVGVSSYGGVSLVSSDENDNKIISLALGSDDNENAFNQDIGLGDDMVYAISDPHVRGKIMGRLKRIFRRFEAQKRYKLLPGTAKWSEDSAEQEIILEFKYLNLESDEEKTFSRTYKTNEQVAR